MVSVAVLPAALDQDLAQCGWSLKGRFLPTSGLDAQPCLFSNSSCMCGCDCVGQCVCVRVCVCVCMSVHVLVYVSVHVYGGGRVRFIGFSSLDFILPFSFKSLLLFLISVTHFVLLFCMKSAIQIKIDWLITVCAFISLHACQGSKAAACTVQQIVMDVWRVYDWC